MKRNAHDAIKKCLQGGNTISQMEAVDFFNCWRLAPIVKRLRDAGMNIVNIGKPGKHAIYVLNKYKRFYA